MSTLITRLGRRFRDKPKSKNLDLPGLPTPREILEDIESCQSGDPIIGLATLIQKKGRQSSLLDKDFFLEDPSLASQDSNLAFLAPYQNSVSTTVGLSDKTGGTPSAATGGDDSSKSSTASSGPGGAHHKRRSSLTLVTGGSGSSKAKSKSTSDAEYLNSYNKLKQFLLLFEKSEEILDSLDPHFKRVESTLCAEETDKDFRDSVSTSLASTVNNITVSLIDNGNILKVESDDDNQTDNNSNCHRRQLSDSSDVCSSPLL